MMNLCILNYQTSASESNGGVTKVNAESSNIGGNRHQQVIITNLEPFTNYSIMMSAETQQGEGPFSTPIYCSTQRSGKQTLILKIHLKQRTSNCTQQFPPT